MRCNFLVNFQFAHFSLTHFFHWHGHAKCCVALLWFNCHGKASVDTHFCAKLAHAVWWSSLKIHNQIGERPEMKVSKISTSRQQRAFVAFSHTQQGFVVITTLLLFFNSTKKKKVNFTAASQLRLMWKKKLKTSRLCFQTRQPNSSFV